MNIILVSNKMAKAKTLSVWQVALMVFLVVAFSVAATWLLTKKATVIQQVVSAKPADLENEAILKQNHLDAYAKELGELQARIMRLDAQNQRLARLAGEKTPQGLTAKSQAADDSTQIDPSSRGGPQVNAVPMSENDLQEAIKNLVATVDSRDEYQSKIEAKILQKSVLKDMLPNSEPVNVAFRSSSYGWRIDPFDGHKAFHEGLDFPATTGTPILAAADGIVIVSGRTNDYGNLVKVDHGSGLETRYAHASKLLVKVGQRVVKGQKIAEVGSTGRSTGPHLHYEIRLNGSALDPRQYLNKKFS
jgi:murein DD-endopeptidase MepM/ murein hydrolase activator NlpD